MGEFLNWLSADIPGLVVQLFFSATIIFMIADHQKPPVITAVLTGLALIVLGSTGSYTAGAVAVGSVVNGGLWLLLAWQRLQQPNDSKKLA